MITKALQTKMSGALFHMKNGAAHRMEGRGGMALRRCRMCAKKQLGVLLALVGMLLVFLCLPMEFLLIALGLAMTITGLWLLGD